MSKPGSKAVKSVSTGGKFKFKSKSSKTKNLLVGGGLVSLDVASKVKDEDPKLGKRTLTESQQKRQSVVESREVEKVAKKSYRERIDEFNNSLASTTEHNDIPRVSAAGNG